MSSARRIVIAGATGFLGVPLTRALVEAGAHVTALSRRATAPPHPAAEVRTWTPDGTAGAWASAIDGADAVINLAGESIGDRRWTADRKKFLVDSRVNATRSLATAIQSATAPPATFISSSGVGYYGPLDDEIVTEETPRGNGFVANMGAAWEDAAAVAESARTRVIYLRTGLVVDAGGGALAPMLLPFRLGLGGPAGSGRQYWAWIHRDDWVRLVIWALDARSVSGGLNATAPNPVTNREFVRALGRALHRPAILPAPAFALRIALGEMADGLLLSGQRAIPAKAMQAGFRFRYEQLDDAFRAIFG